MTSIEMIDKVITEYINETQKMKITFYDKDVKRDFDISMKEIIERAIDWKMLGKFVEEQQEVRK